MSETEKEHISFFFSFSSIQSAELNAVWPWSEKKKRKKKGPLGSRKKENGSVSVMQQARAWQDGQPIEGSDVLVRDATTSCCWEEDSGEWVTCSTLSHSLSLSHKQLYCDYTQW